MTSKELKATLNAQGCASIGEKITYSGNEKKLTEIQSILFDHLCNVTAPGADGKFNYGKYFLYSALFDACAEILFKRRKAANELKFKDSDYLKCSDITRVLIEFKKRGDDSGADAQEFSLIKETSRNGKPLLRLREYMADYITLKKAPDKKPQTISRAQADALNLRSIAENIDKNGNIKADAKMSYSDAMNSFYAILRQLKAADARKVIDAIRGNNATIDAILSDQETTAEPKKVVIHKKRASAQDADAEKTTASKQPRKRSKKADAEKTAPETTASAQEITAQA